MDREWSIGNHSSSSLPQLHRINKEGNNLKHWTLNVLKPSRLHVLIVLPESHFFKLIVPHFSSMLKYYWGLFRVWWGKVKEVGHTWNRCTRWAGTKWRGDSEDEEEMRQRKRPCNSWQSHLGDEGGVGGVKERLSFSTSHICGKLLMRQLITVQIKLSNAIIN